jgi:Na+/H+ antiporter NhaC
LAAAVSFCLPSRNRFSEKVSIFCAGAGDSTLILMVLIYLLAGAFYAAATAMHAADTITNLGIALLPARFILLGLFVTACILSFAMGTSMGTVAALIPIAVNIASRTSVPVPLVCGIVVGGAMFGDNLSFISDTTIAAAATQNVGMKAKFKANLAMVLPAMLLTVLLLGFWPVDGAVSSSLETVDLVNLIPYVLIVALSLFGMHVIGAMSLAILSAILIGIVHQDFSFVECFSILHTGMKSMEDMAMLAILTGGVIAMMKELGGIQWLLTNLTRHTKTRKGAELSIALFVSLVDIATTNNTMAIIAAGPIAKDISLAYDIPPARTASILDIFSSAFNGLVPHAAQLLTAAALAGISSISIVPFVWYSMLMLVFGILFILLGIPKGRWIGE